MKLQTIDDVAHAPIGDHRGPCPKCDRGARDDAVAITVESDGRYVWFCHRCHWAGASNGGRPVALRREPRPQAKHHNGLSEPAAALWDSTSELEGDALAYLKARNCVIPPLDSDLRYIRRLKHPSGYEGPALIALVTNAATAAPVSLHRTWILPNGEKAPVEKPRLLINLKTAVARSNWKRLSDEPRGWWVSHAHEFSERAGENRA